MIYRLCTKRIQGFTFIEILIVLFIISIISTIALLTFAPHPHRELDRLAQRITALITAAEKEAILRPATLGIEVSSSKIQFYEYIQEDKDSWHPLSDPLLHLYVVPTRLKLSLKTENKEKPQIIVSKNGDITPFIIFLQKQGSSPYLKIIGESNGHLKIQRVSS